MRRSVLLLSLAVALCLVLGAGPALAAAPEAHHMGFLYEVSGGFVTVTFLDGQVRCDAPGSYLGRATAIHHETGEVVYITRIKGTCTGSFVSWTSGAERILGSIPCGDHIRWGGQIRFSDGAKIFIGKPPPYPTSIIC